MTAWEAFVANQQRLSKPTALAAVSSPKRLNVDLQPYQTVQASERADILNIGGFSDCVFARVSAFLADNNSNSSLKSKRSNCKRELDSCPTAVYLKLRHPRVAFPARGCCYLRNRSAWKLTGKHSPEELQVPNIKQFILNQHDIKMRK
jgi:hypothetical protein